MFLSFCDCLEVTKSHGLPFIKRVADQKAFSLQSATPVPFLISRNSPFSTPASSHSLPPQLSSPPSHNLIKMPYHSPLYSHKIPHPPTPATHPHDVYDVSIINDKCLLASIVLQVPTSYHFTYQVADSYSGDVHHHSESKTDHKTEGQYSVKLPDGRTQVIRLA